MMHARWKGAPIYGWYELGSPVMIEGPDPLPVFGGLPAFPETGKREWRTVLHLDGVRNLAA